MQARRDASIPAAHRDGWIAPLAASLAAVTAVAALAAATRGSAPDAAGRAVMVPATAIAVLACAVALWLLLQHRGSPAARRVARGSALVTLAIGAGAVAYALGLDPTAIGHAWPLRPSPLTGLGLALAGMSTLAFSFPGNACARLARLAAAGVLWVALTAAIGHLYDEGALYRGAASSATARSTVIALAALGAGLLFADPTRGLAAVLRGRGAAAKLLRRLLPAAVLAPVLLGWAMLALHAAWELRFGFATALLVVALAVLLVGLVVRQAAALHAFEAERERLLAAERAAREQATRVLESITDAFFTVDAEWRFVYVNREAERVLQRPRGELIGRALWEVYPEAVGSVFEREYRRAVAEGTTVHFDAHYAPLDIWVDVRAYPTGTGLSVYFRDDTARKLAERRLRESERNFRAMANNIPQLAWMADAAGAIFWYSERWYEYTGTTFEDMQGWGWQAVHHPDHVQRVVDGIRQAFEQGEAWEDTFPLRGADGAYHWFLSRAVPIRDARGRVLRWFGTNTDITGQRRAAEALRESEERHRLLADLIPQHIWTADAAGQHTWFSRRWHEFAGLDLDASRGEGWLQRLHPDDRDRTLARWRHALRTGEPYGIEYRFLGADGRYHWFLGQALPVRDASGTILEWFGTLTDISDRKQLEQERERLMQRRASLMRGFGHDVKNPLGTAHLHAELLERGLLPGELSPKQLDSVQVIRRSVRNALRLIDDLLELTQAEAGQLVLARVRVDAGEVVQEAAGDFREQAAAAHLQLDLQAPQGLCADADPARLRQILGNLLSNAAKYAPRSRLRLKVERRAADAPGAPGPRPWIAIAVTDDGPGIAPAQHESVFHEYVRLDPGAAQGAGIGLAISRTFARLMGGELALHSEPGRGATFTLWLPATDEPGDC